MGDAQKKGPCRNRGRLPKLTAYEKILNYFVVVCSVYRYANQMPKVTASLLRIT